jgi:hypothetical protein
MNRRTIRSQPAQETIFNCYTAHEVSDGSQYEDLLLLNARRSPPNVSSGPSPGKLTFPIHKQVVARAPHFWARLIPSISQCRFYYQIK